MPVPQPLKKDLTSPQDITLLHYIDHAVIANPGSRKESWMSWEDILMSKMEEKSSESSVTCFQVTELISRKLFLILGFRNQENPSGALSPSSKMDEE